MKAPKKTIKKDSVLDLIAEKCDLLRWDISRLSVDIATKATGGHASRISGEVNKLAALEETLDALEWTHTQIEEMKE